MRLVALVVFVLGSVASLARPAAATVDVTGGWGLTLQSIIGPLPGAFDFVQTGTQLEAMVSLQGGPPGGPYTGTIDPDTGVLTVPLPDTQTFVPGPNVYVTCSGNQITGTASPDSQSITGHWTILFLNIRLMCQDGGGEFTATRARCGDGIREGGETCDDGNVVDGDCCSADCTSAAADGTTCDDADACSLGDHCSAGVCSATSHLSCAPCESCSPQGCVIAEAGGCEPVLAGGKSSIVLRHTAGVPEKDALAWKWKNGDPIAVTDFGDPASSDSYVMCVIDRTGGIPTLRMNRGAGMGTCSGKPCWKPSPGGFTYGSRDGAPEGLTKLTLKAGAAGKGKLATKGKGALLAVPDGGFTAPVTVRLHRYSQPGKCWEARYSTPKRNDGTVFRAKSD